MSNLIEEMAGRALIGGISHGSQVEIVVRDGLTGEIKNRVFGKNLKLYNTYCAIISAVINSNATLAGSLVICGVGSGTSPVIGNTTLTGETGSRTIGALSWDAQAPMFNLSFSFTANANTMSLGQAALFASYTGGFMFLQTSFAQTQVSSQDSLYISWLQSLASA